MKTILPILALLFLVTGCGPDSELVASGKAHRCAINALTTQVAAEPTNTELPDQLRERTELLQAVIESAPEGDRAALTAAIEEAVAAGCD